jgi:Flp pilus assembly protein TadG
MSALLHALRRDARGSTIIGFAIVAPVFIMFVMGAIELGRLGLAAYSTRDAVVTSSRMFRLHPLPTDAAVAAAVTNRFAKSGSDVLGQPAITQATQVIAGQTVTKKTISFSVNHKLVIPFMGQKTVPISYATTIITHSA